MSNALWESGSNKIKIINRITVLLLMKILTIIILTIIIIIIIVLSATIDLKSCLYSKCIVCNVFMHLYVHVSLCVCVCMFSPSVQVNNKLVYAPLSAHMRTVTFVYMYVCVCVIACRFSGQRTKTFLHRWRLFTSLFHTHFICLPFSFQPPGLFFWG